MTRALLVATMFLSACGDSTTGQLIVDLSGVVSRMDTLVEPIEHLSVRLTAPHNGEQEIEVTEEDPVFEITVASGPLFLEGLGVRADEVPVYYGDARVIIPPHGTVEVVVPMFPAGLIDVEVFIDPEDAPDLAVVTFFPLAPRRDQSTAFDAPFHAERIRRVLPSGEYTFQAQASFNGGKSYKAVGPDSEVIEILHGDILDETLDLRD